ncbi:MAG: sodium/proline symporter PutP [Arachnia sp.]
MSENTYQVIAMVAYFALMIGIGWWGYRRTKDFDDYMIGGRSLGPLPTALSAGASDMSGWLLMGLPGALYASGLVELWIAVGLTVGAWLNWRYVAPRLRTYTVVAGNAITIPSFFGNRLHDTTKLLRMLSGIIILAFFTFYVSSGMVAGGVFFQSAYGWSYTQGLLLVSAIVVAYTLAGGFIAVVYTDTVQGLMMVVALIAVPVAGMIYLGGPGATIDAVQAVDPHALALWGAGTTAVGVISALAWGLGYFGQPHIIVRFMALRSAGEAKSARRIGIGWMILAALGAAGTALVGIGVFQRDPTKLPDAETVFIELGKLLFHPLIGGLLLAAILAAIMSTISSQLLVSSSALVEDLYRSFSRRQLSNRAAVAHGRAAVLAVSLLALALAWQQNDTILDLVAFAWAGFGASFGPIVLLSLYWKRLTSWGALAGMAVGAITVAVWGNLSGGILDIYEILPGFAFNLVIAVAVSLLSPAPPDEVTAEFDEHLRLVSDFETSEPIAGPTS